MTPSLEHAFSRASQLSEADQDAFASLLLTELDASPRWIEAFSPPQDRLDAVAADSRRDLESGEAWCSFLISL